MRLKEIQKILSDINFKESKLKVDYQDNSLKNIKEYKVFLDVVSSIPIYNEEIDWLSQSEIYSTSQDILYLERLQVRELYLAADYITTSASSLFKVLGKLLPDSSEDSINIKLPEPTDLDSLVKTMAIVQKSLSQVVLHNDIDGAVKINNWEHGSFWVELILGTQAAVALVSSIAWSAAVVCKKYKENEILEETIRSLKIKNESLDDVLNGQKEMTKTLIESEANQVVNQHYTEGGPEQIRRVEASIKAFAKLIQEGAEVHPTLMAPEKVQNLFPNYNKIESITSRMKLLEQESPTDITSDD
ncbi:hypothetical protein IMCC1989_1544 [gamma proteobacterium IMCC1989]|nr:hypothetical protein IMCC1989_1544 [gamma proteobacterium IMCC1989]